MSDEMLRALASKHGVSPTWIEQTGAERQVSPDSLRAILASLGVPADTDEHLRNSMSLSEAGVNLAASAGFTTARVGQSVGLPIAASQDVTIEVTLESGATRTVTGSGGPDGALTLPPFATPDITACEHRRANSLSPSRQSAAFAFRIVWMGAKASVFPRRSIRCARLAMLASARLQASVLSPVRPASAALMPWRSVPRTRSIRRTRTITALTLHRRVFFTIRCMPIPRRSCRRPSSPTSSRAAGSATKYQHLKACRWSIGRGPRRFGKSFCIFCSILSGEQRFSMTLHAQTLRIFARPRRLC